MKKNFWKSFVLWLPFAAVISFVCLFGYILVQQDLRMNANDPQVQIAEDIVHNLSTGVSPTQIIPPSAQIDITATLDPYVMIFDDSGKVLASSALLNGQTPTMPAGVFSDARQSGEDRFTWQPEPGVRAAVVLQHFSGANPGFVMVGRSLREVEQHEDNILHLALLAWTAGLIVMFFILLVIVSGERGMIKSEQHHEG